MKEDRYLRNKGSNLVKANEGTIKSAARSRGGMMGYQELSES
jgi:hypothetical protein